MLGKLKNISYPHIRILLILSYFIQNLPTHFSLCKSVLLLLMKKIHLRLINLNVESLLLLSMTKVRSRKYAWSSDLFSVINGYSFHNMTVITPHSTRDACYTILLTSNTKRPASFLVRGHSETHLLESSVILVTSYSSITICVSACTFPNFMQ